VDTIVLGCLGGLGDIDVGDGEARARSAARAVDVQDRIAGVGHGSVDVVNGNTRNGQGARVICIAGAQMLVIAIMSRNNDRVIDVGQFDVIILDILDISCGNNFN
jgi:hypothetical protein